VGECGEEDMVGLTAVFSRTLARARFSAPRISASVRCHNAHCASQRCARASAKANQVEGINTQRICGSKMCRTGVGGHVRRRQEA